MQQNKLFYLGMMLQNTYTRRRFQIRLGAITTGLFATNIIAAAVPLRDIPMAKSLLSEISAALKAGYPLLVFISLDSCPYCKIAHENYLLPMINEQSVPIVQVNFRYTNRLEDWSQKIFTHDQLIRAWGVKVAPTILFLGKEGREIAPRLIGSSTSDFYASLLEERIRTAQTAIKSELVSK